MKKHFLAAGAMALSWMVAQAGVQTVPGHEAPALARQVCVTCHGPGGRKPAPQLELL
jgi:mono/diheme cytochrome c family protein